MGATLSSDETKPKMELEKTRRTFTIAPPFKWIEVLSLGFCS
jgi:hypothetical protein